MTDPRSPPNHIDTATSPLNSRHRAQRRRDEHDPSPICLLDHAHYAGNLVDGAYGVALFGDVATEMCVRTDGDEGLFASYSDVQFRRLLLRRLH